MKKYQSGFTVLELLIVIAIMSILIGLVLASFGSAKKNVDDKRAVALVQSLQTGLEQYRAICRTYPKTLSDSANNSVIGTCTTTLGDVMPGIDDLPQAVIYTSLQLASNTSANVCDAYHLGITVVNNSPILLGADDKDFTPVAGVWVPCDASGQLGDINTDEYDVVSPGVNTTNVGPNQNPNPQGIPINQ